MKVTTVSASVRFSGTVGDSRFKTIELSAEATLDGKDVWTEAQARLYQQLGCQLKALWADGIGHKAQDDPVEPTEAPSEPEPTETHQQLHQSISAWSTRGSLRDIAEVIVFGGATRRQMGSGVGKSRRAGTRHKR